MLHQVIMLSAKKKENQTKGFFILPFEQLGTPTESTTLLNLLKCEKLVPPLDILMELVGKHHIVIT